MNEPLLPRPPQDEDTDESPGDDRADDAAGNVVSPRQRK